MGRVSHFEITADDPERAAAFYRRAFGWEINDWGGTFKYLLTSTGPDDQIGINGAIMDRNDSKQAAILTVSVDTWEAGAKAVEDAGGTMLMPKTPVPGQGYFAYGRDTEGNVFGIFEADAKAQAEPAGVGSAQQSGS